MPGPCPACHSPESESFYELPQVPTNSCILLDSLDEALDYPQDALELTVCHVCGFVWNDAFKPGLTTYSSSYEETQGFSPHFQKFARELAAQWVHDHDLKGVDILEIGCGKGEFLALLCELGDNHGVGIDPAYVPGRLDSKIMDHVDFIVDWFGDDSDDITAEAVVCRHTLEHIAPVAGFLRTVRAKIGDRDPVVLFELPDAWRVLRETAFWDIYYEHCSYFTPGSLARLFRQEGFAVTNLELAFDDQYLLLEAKPARGPVSGPQLELEEDPKTVVSEARAFASRFEKIIAERRALIAELISAGQRAVVWGAGSKGVAWLTTLQVRDEIPVAVDINPNKHGKFIAGSGQRIVAPEELRHYRPDTVIVMNPSYTEEIRTSLSDLGLSPRLVDA